MASILPINSSDILILLPIVSEDSKIYLKICHPLIGLQKESFLYYKLLK